MDLQLAGLLFPFVFSCNDIRHTFLTAPYQRPVDLTLLEVYEAFYMKGLAGRKGES